MSAASERGVAVLYRMLVEGKLEEVPPSSNHALALIAQARRHLDSARSVLNVDAEGAYTLLYDAARKSLQAVLAQQGLRTTSVRGHHRNLADAVLAHLDPPHGQALRPIHRLRQLRAAAEYPNLDSLPLTVDEVSEDLAKAEVIVDICAVAVKTLPGRDRTREES